MAGTVVLLGLLLQRQRRLPREMARVLPALALFPLAQIGLLALLSDWPLWYWYFYPLLLAELGCAMALAATAPKTAARGWPIIAAGVTVVSLAYTVAYNVVDPPRRNPILLAAESVTEFAATHPGVYAMGDRSGMVGYLLPQPLIQLEGLTMDRAYLARVRAQPELIAVLREYGARYYVSTDAEAGNGCFRVREPGEAGPDSAHMAGEFCGQPAWTFADEGVVTRIFEVGR
jgi:hypothetical protein